MRLASITEQPKLSTRLLLDGDKQTKDAWNQVREEFGVARVMQTETGTLRALRLNESTGRLEKYSGGKWNAITAGGATPPAATSPILWGNNSGYLRTPFTFGSNLTVEGTLRVGTLAGILKAAAGEVGVATIGSSLSYAAPTLNTIQDIRTSASPTFAGLTTSGATLLGDAATADVELFKTGTVADATDGKKFTIHRKAAEFNRRFWIYVVEDGTVRIEAPDGGVAFFASTSFNFYSPTTRFGRSWSTFNDVSQFYGYVTGAAAQKYAQFQLANTGAFTLSPQDANVTKFLVSMDFDVTGNIAVSGTVDTVDIAAHAANVTTHGDWPTGLDVSELGYVNGVTSAIQTQLDTKASVDATYRTEIALQVDGGPGMQSFGAGASGPMYRTQAYFDPTLMGTITAAYFEALLYKDAAGTTASLELYKRIGGADTQVAQILASDTAAAATNIVRSADCSAALGASDGTVCFGRTVTAGGTIYYQSVRLVLFAKLN